MFFAGVLAVQVGQCNLKPGVGSAWFQCLKRNVRQQLSRFAFNFNLHRYIQGCAAVMSAMRVDPAIGGAVQVESELIALNVSA